MSRDACSRCGRPVRTVITEGGKVRDLNPMPDDDGNHILITTAAGNVRARVLSGGPGAEMPAPAGQGFTMHRCPPPEPPGPACAVCHGPMPRELALLERWTTHPCCDPEYGRILAELAIGVARTAARQNTRRRR